jgi:hypothetical protein
MKINWGTAIVITFVIFASLLTWAVTESFKADHHLVTKNYYEEELKYDSRMKEIRNLKGLGNQFQFTEMKDQFTIQFPSNWDKKELSGVISFYKPDNIKLDFQKRIEPNTSMLQVVKKEDLATGKWRMTIRFEHEGKMYHFEEMFFL